MRALVLHSLFCLAVGYALAHFCVLLYNNWYFADLFWLKTALLTPVLGLGYAALLNISWRRFWQVLGWWCIAAHVTAVIAVKGPDLRALGFTAVLDLEAAMIWPTTIAIAVYAAWQSGARWRLEAAAQRKVASQLELRRRLRRKARRAQQAVVATFAIAAALAYAVPARAEDPEPQRVFPNRHEELSDPAKQLSPEAPPWPGIYPTPAALRARDVFFIVIENKRDGAIMISQPDANGNPAADGIVAGHVLAPVTQINPKGFTASGWALPGTLCATAVNAIHICTDHDYAASRGVIFTLCPLEFAEFNPKDYKSYFNKSSSLFTDIPAGTAIFGGQWAPLVGSKLLLAPGGDITKCTPAVAGYVPKDGDKLVIRVEHHKYNPEWIEFENSFGGLIWVKEIGLQAYPIGQVLKPVVGVGRFLGSQYAGIGRIRASHPGVLCISTSPEGTIGGFQIIPRDHAMSPEMTYARVKTQWMVVGPLWALDPSWEGLPPLFTDYFYPAFTPALNADGTLNDDLTGAAVFLNRFTVRARYSDAEDPDEYILLREANLIDNYALKTLTHLRVYFPRG